MSIASIFNSGDEFDSAFNATIRPLWTLGEKLEDDEAMLEWQNNAYQTELKRQARYRESAVKHISLYKGKHYAEGARRGYADTSSQGLAYRAPQVSKLVVNYTYQGVQNRVALLTRNRPTVTIEPTNSEYADRISARLTKHWVDYMLWRLEFERQVREAVTGMSVIGEVYGFPFWNPNLGEPTQAWNDAVTAAKASGQQPMMPVTDAEGNPVLDKDGQQLMIQRPVRVGDMDMLILSPLNALVETCGRFVDAKWFFYEEWRDIDELRAEYPDAAEKLKAETAVDSLGNPDANMDRDPNKVLVRQFWHKSTDFMGRGRFVLSTRTVILENKPLPEGMTSLPLVRLSDIDVPGEQRAIPLLAQGKALNATLNDFASMMRRNTILSAHPRWLIPKGSLAKRDALGNDITQIEFSGPEPPRMVSPPPLSQEVTALRREFRDEIMQLFRVSDAQQGKVPPNIRSAMAMQMLDEADEQRANTDVSKVQTFVRQCVERMLEIAACYYEKSDPRLIPVVGRDQRYLLQEFDPKHLKKGFDVRVTNSSGLPSTKSARTEMLVQLKTAFPKLVRDEQVADLLEFADVERFYDQAAVATRAAEAENEAILGGEAVADPMALENTLVHWSIHMREVQNRGFKTTTPPEIQQTMVTHLMATEMLMLEAARRNPAFAMELVKLPQFPALYELDTVDRIVLDRARTGVPLTLMEIQLAETQGVMPSPAPPGPVTAPSDMAAEGAQLPPGVVPPVDMAGMGAKPDVSEPE